MIITGIVLEMLQQQWERRKGRDALQMMKIEIKLNKWKQLAFIFPHVCSPFKFLAFRCRRCRRWRRLSNGKLFSLDSSQSFRVAKEFNSITPNFFSPIFLFLQWRACVRTTYVVVCVCVVYMNCSGVFNWWKVFNRRHDDGGVDDGNEKVFVEKIFLRSVHRLRRLFSSVAHIFSPIKMCRSTYRHHTPHTLNQNKNEKSSHKNERPTKYKRNQCVSHTVVWVVRICSLLRQYVNALCVLCEMA